MREREVYFVLKIIVLVRIAITIKLINLFVNRNWVEMIWNSSKFWFLNDWLNDRNFWNKMD